MATHRCWVCGPAWGSKAALAGLVTAERRGPTVRPPLPPRTPWLALPCRYQEQRVLIGRRWGKVREGARAPELSPPPATGPAHALARPGGGARSAREFKGGRAGHCGGRNERRPVQDVPGGGHAGRAGRPRRPGAAQAGALPRGLGLPQLPPGLLCGDAHARGPHHRFVRARRRPSRQRLGPSSPPPRPPARTCSASQARRSPCTTRRRRPM